MYSCAYVHTFRRLDTDLGEALGFLHRPDNSFNEFFNLLIQPTNIRILLRRLLIHLHRLNPRIIFRRKSVEDEIGVFVDADEIARFELFVVDEADERQEDGLTSTSLDDG